MNAFLDRIHEGIIFICSLPMITYCLVMEYVDIIVATNKTYADKLFLKRIDITEEEFPEFLEWKRGIIERRRNKK